MMIQLLRVFCCLGLLAAPALADEPQPVHGFAMHDVPKYGPDFTHLDYVNPQAPKGGTVKLAAIGSFDTFNPFVVKGTAPDGIGGLFETLTTRAEDEAFSEYGLLAESLTVPEDRSWVAFTLRREARWHDGQPVTADDVIFSFNVLREQGAPLYRFYYASVIKAEKLDPRTVKFTFGDTENRELPLILGQLPVLPQHYWQDREFDATSLDIPVGSGPYRIESFEAGRSITYVRDPDYWGDDLAVKRGQDNFQRIRYDFYRDPTVALVAFKAGEYDFRLENSSKDWAVSYDVPAVRQGLIEKVEIPNNTPAGMQGFVFNLRRPLFADARVRLALSYAFDFEWSNKNLFYDQYQRAESYFAGSELAATGLPEGEEKEILERFRGRIPEAVFTTEFHAPSTDGSGNNRDNLKVAHDLLKEAGWVIGADRKLIHGTTGEHFAFEILLVSPAFERIVLPYKKNLERLGIELSVRLVDSSIYQERVETFDFDMTTMRFGASLSPGNEQREFWGSAAAERPGSRNVIGIKDPIIDQLVELLIAAPNRQSLVARSRALDRVLLWNHFLVPHWYTRVYRVAYWDKFGRPPLPPRYGLGFNSWWIDDAKASSLEQRKSQLGDN